MSMVDPETRAFNSEEPLIFDKEGRSLVYDGLASNLKRKLGFFSIGTKLGGLLLFQTYPASYVLDLNALLHWGGITYFGLMSLLQLSDIRMRQLKIHRIFLLKGGQVARLHFNSGTISDIPISAISQVSYDK